MKAFQRIVTLILALAMLFSFSSCLAELNLGSSDREETKETAAQTTDIEGIEKNLKKLQNNADLSYQKMADSERAFEEQRLNTQYGTGLDNSIKKAYSVEQNDTFLKVYEFKKTSDAKTLEGLLKESIQNGVYVQNLKVVRKNNVILFGDADLLDLITSGKSSGSKETTETKPPQTTAPGTELPDDPRDEVDKNGYLKDSLPEDLYFNQTVRILGEEKYHKQFAISLEDVEASGKPVDMAIYQRNVTVEDRLGIEFEWSYAQGDWVSKDVFMKKVETSCQNEPYDATICYNLLPSLIASKGYAANVYGSKYLDLTGPWWPQAYTNEMLINETIYGIPESNDYGLLKNMMAIFFNQELVDGYMLQDPYELVANNEWTMAKFSSMIKDTYEDLNRNARADEDDLYGFVNATIAKRDAWFYALGYRYAEVQDGEIVSLWEKPEIETYIDTMIDFYASGDALLNDTNQHKIFLDQRAYFYAAAVGLMAEAIKKSEVDIRYGIVPYPKLNTQQSRYYTHLSNPYDAWCVPYNVRNMDMTSAVMECMASESYRTVGPTYYNTIVNNGYAADEELAPMYDLIRDSVTFDFGYLYYPVFLSNNNPKDIIKSCITSPTQSNWASMYQSYKNMWQNAFEQIVAVYQ